ncbi:MAG: CpaF family protein [Rickettsiales bacterium]|nr:CpaF family protein [Rickettsiales bacterium]
MFGKKTPTSSGTTPPIRPENQAEIPSAAANDAASAHASAPPAGSQLPSVIASPEGAVNPRDHFGNALQIMAKLKPGESEAPSLISYLDTSLETPDFQRAKARIIQDLVDNINFASLQKLPQERKRQRVLEVAEAAYAALEIPLTQTQINLLTQQCVDEILGLGPLEPLLADPEVADIMINTFEHVYIERRGKIFITDVKFLSERHLLGIIQRIVSRVGRRIDEASPMVDARLEDGSRFNAIIPPLALDGCLVSIRKFKKSKMALEDYVAYDSMSAAMARFLHLCAFMRLNIIISGGTGSGKTTLLNALSGGIDAGERVITIEDAAELQLRQPHVLRLETRPISTEGAGEVTQRQLVRNALRMRPDRIILGEIRGDEVIDVLSAMNTGHDGSMATIHSNNPRDCLSRIENLVSMSGVQVPHNSLRYQISSAVQLIVQIARMRDGKRRITHIEEIVGTDGDTIITQPIFTFKMKGMKSDGTMDGEFTCSGIRPRFAPKAEYFGIEKELMECLGIIAKTGGY